MTLDSLAAQITLHRQPRLITCKKIMMTNAAFLDFAPVHMAAFAQFHAVNGVSSMMRTHLERFDNTEASPVIHSADSTLGGAVESMGVMKKAVLYARVSTDAQEKEGTIESQ